MAATSVGRRALAGLFALALVGTACGSGSDDDDGDDAAGGGAAGEDEFCTAERAGGEVTVGTWLAFHGLDPIQIQGTAPAGGDIATAFYGSLLHYNPAEDTYEPGIAESVEPDEDRSVWTVRLREGVTFGNGDPFTAEHVAAHIERMKEGRVRSTAMAEMVESVEVVDDLELVVTLFDPANLQYMLAADLGWVPNNNLVTERGDGFHIDPAGAGAGAFELERLSETPGEELVLSGKDDWWGGEVCLDTLRFVNINGEEALLEAFESGELDTVFGMSNRTTHELEEQGLLAYSLPIGMNYHGVADQGVSGLTDLPFNDVRVREAIQLAIDYELVSSRAWDDLPPYTTSAVVPEDSPLWTEGLQGPPYDPERARELVEETVAEGVWDGSFTFLYRTEPELQELAVLLEGLWEAAGMEVTLETQADTAQPILVDRDFEVGSWGTSINPPWPYPSAATMECDTPRNRTGFCDPEMDEALAALREAITLEEVREALVGLQEVYNRTFPIFTTRHAAWGIGAQEHVRGLQVGTEAVARYDRVWVDG